MTDMSHDEALAELAAVALDSASSDVSESVRAHAAVCPECGPELASMEETIAVLGHLVPGAQMNRGRGAGIRSRLVMRARAERESKSAPVPGRPDINRGVASLTGLGHKTTPSAQRAVSGETRRVTPGQVPVIPSEVNEPPHRAINWIAIAASLALVATGAQLVRVTSQRNEMRNQIAAADTLAPRADSLASMVNQKDAMITAMTGPDVKVVPLSNQSSRDPLGRMIWNRSSNDWVMVTHGLKPPREGMVYQVWLVTDDAQVSAGTFRPDKDGKTMMHARYTMPREALRSVAVTEEPEGGMPAPTGPMVIVGSA